MKNTVKILGRDYELFASTQAVSEISEMCGGINHITEYIYGTEQEPNSQIEQIKRVVAIIEKMINAAIKRDNYAIKNGFMDGEEKKLFSAGDLVMIVGIKDTAPLLEGMVRALKDDTDYDVPEGVAIDSAEVDETLNEIREKRAKNGESGE